MNEFKSKVLDLKYKVMNYLREFKSDIESIKDKGAVNLIRKRSKFIVAFISILTLFSLSLIISFTGDNKDSVVNNFIESMEKSNAKMLSKCLRVNGEKVSREELEPLILYYEARTEEVNKIVSEIKAKGESNIFKVVKDDSTRLERYYVDINKVNGVLSSNIKEALFYIGERNYKSGDEIKDIIPGTYNVKYELQTEYGNVAGEKEVELISNADININLPATYITLASPIFDAKVYISGKYIGKEVQEVKGFGPIPTDRDVKMYIEKEFPWGAVKSEEVLIGNENIINIDMDIANETLDNNIKEVVNGFYDSVFEALNEKDKMGIINSTEEVGEKIFDYINKKTFMLSNNYTISDLQVELEKSDFKYEDNDKYSASIVTSINYSINKKLLPFVKDEGDGMFLLGLDYKDNNWLISSIQKFEME